MSRPRTELAVFLCTYNGSRHLTTQLESLVFPEGCDGRIYVSDDGSTDATPSILKQFSQSGSKPPLSVRRGPSQGHRANFLSLLCAEDIEADYFAFCDQDDRWDSDKLHRALDSLTGLDPDVPAIYCSRTRSMTESGVVTGLSPLFTRAPSFANALIQNIAGGNTMVMNAPARNILRQAGNVDVVMHDWWSYLMVTAAGGVVIYDAEPALDYRQHEGNLVGANLGIRSRTRRYLKFLDGVNREWNTRNVAALRQNEDLLSPENRQVLGLFEQMRSGNLWQRLVSLWRSGVYAQTLSGNIGLFAATLLKKI